MSSQIQFDKMFNIKTSTIFERLNVIVFSICQQILYTSGKMEDSKSGIPCPVIIIDKKTNKIISKF